MTVQDLTFDDAPSEQSAAGRPYRGAEGRTDRISIIFFHLDPGGQPDLTRPRVQRARTQYHPSVGTVLCHSGEPGADEEVWNKLEPPRERYATLLLKYPTDPSGKVQQDASGIVIAPWDFGEPTFRRLHDLSVEQRPLGRNLGNVDLRVTCANTRKQHLEISVVGAAIWRMKPEAQERFLARALALYGAVRIGRDLPEVELRRSLGLPASSPTDDELCFAMDPDLVV